LNDLAVNTGREIETLTVVDHGAAGPKLGHIWPKMRKYSSSGAP
jgi:hypothetical protein